MSSYLDLSVGRSKPAFHRKCEAVGWKNWFGGDSGESVHRAGQGKTGALWRVQSVESEV